MTPIEGEIAVLGLVISNVMWPSILGALFLSRIWKVSTATKKAATASAPQAADAVTTAPAAPLPSIDSRRSA